jgi:PAS domain-containing protein
VVYVYADQDARAIEESAARVISGGEHEFETRHRMKGGEVREVLVSACPVVIGREKRVLAVVQDQTGRSRRARSGSGSPFKPAQTRLASTDWMMGSTSQ